MDWRLIAAAAVCGAHACLQVGPGWRTCVEACRAHRIAQNPAAALCAGRHAAVCGAEGSAGVRAAGPDQHLGRYPRTAPREH